MSFEPIHQHLIIRGHSTNPITDPEISNQFLLDLVDHIGMVPATKPQSKYITTPGNEGLTGGINVCTSHICFHVWDINGLFMIDVYSCTCFDILDTVRFIQNKWSLDDIRYLVLDREDLSIYDYRLLKIDER